MTNSIKAATKTRSSRRMSRKRKAQPKESRQAQVTSSTENAQLNAEPANADQRVTKTSLVLGLLGRDEGATIEQMVGVTGWLPPTTRAALTGLKKKGHLLSSDKCDGIRTYRIMSSGAAL